MTIRKYHVFSPIILLLGLLSAFVAQADPVTYSLVYSGNLNGELEPCGCSIEGNSGGIMRRAQKLDELRAETPGIFVISAGGLVNNGLLEERLKSKFIFDGYAQLGYDAIGVQWPDIRYGVGFAQRETLPWVASNWLGDEFAASYTITHGEKSLAFYSWLAPEDSPYRAMQGNHRVVSESLAPLSLALRRARESGVMTVLASTYSLAQAQEKLPLADVDVLIVKSAYEEYPAPELVDGTLVLQAGSRGLRLGKLSVQFEPGKGIAGWRHEVISLPPAVPNAKRLEAWYQAYNDAVAKAYQTSVIRKREARKVQAVSPFIGDKACQACHVEAHSIYKKSRHAKAFSTLERVNKAFDPECIACHSVGFNKPGGFIDIDSTGYLKNVQCESCHGEGRAHAQSAGRLALGHQSWAPEQMCAQCHTPPHSPKFDFENYVTKIRH